MATVSTVEVFIFIPLPLSKHPLLSRLSFSNSSKQIGPRTLKTLPLNYASKSRLLRLNIRGVYCTTEGALAMCNLRSKITSSCVNAIKAYAKRVITYFAKAV